LPLIISDTHLLAIPSSKRERNERPQSETSLSITARTVWWKIVFPGAVALALLLPAATGNAFQAGDRQVHLNGQSLDVTWDALTRAPQTITAVGSDLLEVKNIAGLTKREINDIGALLVSKYGLLLKVRPEHLVLKKAEKTDGVWHVNYQQTVRGVAVYDSSLGFSIDSEGRIKSLDAILYPDARPPGSAKIHRGQALKVAHGCLLGAEKKEYRLRGETVVIYPERKAGSVDYRQVYIFHLFPRKNGHQAPPAGGFAVLVDAQTGRVVRTQALLKPPGRCLTKNGASEEEQGRHKLRGAEPAGFEGPEESFQ